ncbi:sensor domain-containing diguanylate cyclase [Immundisolibacter sp.]|uniref:sensor domain-containing diguanylate cyclase n=1 Tax=Immundisolibacter sp. TaxID=1934948 RepID=UPI0035616635
MQAPDNAVDEAGRLDALHSLNVLDTDPEERFDRLTRTARRLFDVPIALVSLVDANRQWFKSCMGLGVRETPRDVSFCGHTILGNDVFVITNACEDPRFADNPLVTGEPHIRFYAGCPLTGGGGHKLGTLCVIDSRPREFGPDDAAALKDLAAMAQSELTAMRMATEDALTGILNRRGFEMLAQQALSMCLRQGSAATLLFFDLDKFKQVNDTYGHAAGDHLLQRFAAALAKSLRDSDVCGRLGGDEFVALLTNTDKRAATEVVAKVRAVCAAAQVDPGEPSIAFSHGVVEFDPERHASIAGFLADGDAKMYAIKRSR